MRQWAKDWLAKANTNRSTREQLTPADVLRLLQREHGICYSGAYESVYGCQPESVSAFGPKPWVVDWLREANKPRSVYQRLEPYHVVDLLQIEHGISLREAYASTYVDGHLIFPDAHDDWRSYARFLNANTQYSIGLIGSLVVGWFGEQCEETVRRLLDETGKYRENKRKQDRRYWQRVQEDEAKHEQRKAAMRAYYKRNRGRILEQQKEYRNR